MSAPAGDLGTVDLDTCGDEPIHIPGHVQPHGALLAFDLEGRLTHRSRNAQSVFSLPLPFGEPPSGVLGQDGLLHMALASAMRDASAGQQGAARATEIQLCGVTHDVVLHAFGGRVLVELERRTSRHASLAEFALMAHRAMARLRNRSDIAAMLQEVVATVHEVTGFDRVVAYRFQHDDSGEVVAETHGAGLDSYLGRRFPASDIPAQARRLYLLNTLRLISDVNDVQIEIESADPRAAPLDLSYSVLRSVSPIHIEYLKNIRVAASMSLSIVVGGRLWGLIACHHREAHRVPYALRMACDVLAQVVSSSVQAALERGGMALRAASAALRIRLSEVVLHLDDLLQGFADERAALGEVVAFDACLFAYAGKTSEWGSAGDPPAAPLLAWLSAQPQAFVAANEFSALPATLRDQMHPWCGLLALCFDRSQGGWIVLLRREQLETVTWSGPADKVARLDPLGPLGARLTPDGSFAEWRQQVVGTALPWTEAERELARQLLDELSRAATTRRAETDRARAQLLVVLGHDLRDPLHSIGIAARILEGDGAHARLGRRIAVSTGRMERLITQVLDISKLQGGLGLGLKRQSCDMAALVRSSIEDMGFAYPDVAVRASLPHSLHALLDPDRFVQVLSNLLGNARQHGTVGEPITVLLAGDDEGAVLQVRNAGEAVRQDEIVRLFDPIKPRSQNNPRNPNGLGMGLYIASEIVKGHGGTLAYSFNPPEVVFTATLPGVAA